MDGPVQLAEHRVAAVGLTALLGLLYSFNLAYHNSHLEPGDVAERQAVADRITSYDVIADPDHLSRLSLAVLSAER